MRVLAPSSKSLAGAPRRALVVVWASDPYPAGIARIALEHLARRLERSIFEHWCRHRLNCGQRLGVWSRSEVAHVSSEETRLKVRPPR